MAKLLDFILRVGEASKDEATEDLLKMADPDAFSTRQDMEEHFESVLGYDPMHHFDRKLIEEQFKEFSEAAPFSVQERLYSTKEDIINRVLETADDVNDTVLRQILSSVIEDTTGWRPTGDDISVEQSIGLAIFGESRDNDSDDSDSEDELFYSDDEDEDDYSSEESSDDDDEDDY